MLVYIYMYVYICGYIIIEDIYTYIHIWNEKKKKLGLIFYLIFRLFDKNCKIFKCGGVPVQCKAVDNIRMRCSLGKTLSHHARDMAIDIILCYY